MTQIAPPPSYRFGIDLGGTKIEIIALDPVSGAECFRKRIPTPRGDYAGTLTTIRGLVENATSHLGGGGSVGIGIPGTASPSTGLIKNANSTWLTGKTLDVDLADALGQPVRIANDADCFALSEATDGAGAGHRTVFGMILGTGCGGGIVVDGHLLSGPARTAGEIGHMPMPNRQGDLPDPGPCYCGRRGCVEQFLSGPSMAADHQRVTGDIVDTREIARRATQGEPEALATLNRYTDRLAEVLGMLVTLADPDIVVLGGGVSSIEAIYPAVAKALPRFTFGDEAPTPVRPPHYGDSSGVRGAAWLWS